MIQLKLETNEVNGILQALGQLPYVQVEALIRKIVTQAEEQSKQQSEIEQE